MPSALEKLVKILRLEQEIGYKNTAVIGGLASYATKWTSEAHQQARTNEHHALVEELAKVIHYYGELEDHDSRYNTIRYMLGRITGRVEALPQFRVEWTQDQASSEEDEPVRASQPPVEAPPRRELPPSRSKPQPRAKAPVVEDDDDDDGDFGDVEEDIIEESFELVGTVSAFAQQELIRKEHLPKPRREPRESMSVDDAFARWRRLEEPVSNLKGVGPRRAEQLARIGVETISDLIYLFPRRYDDYTQVLPLGKVIPMERVTVVGTIADFSAKMTRDRRHYLQVMLEDKSGKLPVTFFGQPHLKRYFRPGMQLALYGKVELYLGKPQMSNPDWEEVDPDGVFQGAIVPVYPLTKGLTNKVLRNLIEQALQEFATRLPDYVPLSVLERTELVDLDWALIQVHFPESHDYLGYAQERLAFDELMILQLGVLAKRRDWQSVAGIPLPVGEDWVQEFVSHLPYTLTGAQYRAIEAIRRDVAGDVPMNRLLQGDVGAGKTVVAALALAMAVVNGKQAAIMAPTSILAEQHYHSLTELMQLVPGVEHVEVRLLTGATTEAERSEIYEGLASGRVQVVVGTHAIIQENVEFADLALAVIDEQHRFGVDERGNLRGKGVNPHILVMTATPIPRTLALTMFADLDLTVLDEMPPGRTPIQTRFLHPSERERGYNFIRQHLEEGRQAYIIYPLVEASENIQARSAVASFEELNVTDFYEYNVGLMHGRLKPSEKDAIMAAFVNHELDVLVSTSVIEVGINVPNATVIMIEGANRFGLAQLHQLRGRVGRGEHKSYCLLLADSLTDDAERRMHALEETTDGFKLAELDWELRGAGDLLGTRQAGVGTVKMERSMNIGLVELAQIESKSLFAEDPYLELPEHALLVERIDSMRRRDTDFS